MAWRTSRARCDKNSCANVALMPCVYALLCVGAFVLLYYFLYIRYQRVDGFYTYWQSFFLPHTLSEYPRFFRTLLGIFEGFSPFVKWWIMPLYILLGLVGLIVAYWRDRKVFCLSGCCLLVYVGLSLARIYPFGHEGIIGGRLSLYMCPIFHLLATHALMLLYEKRRAIWIILIACIMLVTLARYGRIYPDRHYIQQTHALIHTLHARATPRDSIVIFQGSRPAFMYYSFLEGKGVIDPRVHQGYITLSDNIAQLESILAHHKSPSRIFLLISHYNEEWFSHVRALCLQADAQAEFIQGKGGWGSWLIIIH